MEGLVNKLFRRYGTPMTLERSSGNVTVRGFVEHTATSARKYFLTQYSTLGEISQRYCLILLPKTYTPVEGKMLMHNGRWYILRKVEGICFGSKMLYYQCLCEDRGESDKWGR